MTELLCSGGSHKERNLQIVVYPYKGNCIIPALHLLSHRDESTAEVTTATVA